MNSARSTASPADIAYPLLLAPVYKDYIWGGRRIAELYGRDLPGRTCAESWEIADRAEGMSVVLNGSLRGKKLHDLVEMYGPALVGSGRQTGAFPLLIKIIDAHSRLSVQVHPGEAAAAGGDPKTEAWHVLAAEEGARVFAGLRDGVDRKALERALSERRIEDVLRTVPVSAGDAVYVPAGLVHAIDAGCLILETQQNSNTVFRLYDWGRAGHGGKPRELHIDEAMRSIDWSVGSDAKTTPRLASKSHAASVWDMIACRYFRVERIELRGELNNAGRAGSFAVLFATAGSVNVTVQDMTVGLQTGASCLLPAAVEEYVLEPGAVAAEALRISLP